MNLNESNASDRNEILSATANEPSEASTSTKLQTRNKNNVTNLYYGSTTTAIKQQKRPKEADGIQPVLKRPTSGIKSLTNSNVKRKETRNSKLKSVDQKPSETLKSISIQKQGSDIKPTAISKQKKQ